MRALSIAIVLGPTTPVSPARRADSALPFGRDEASGDEGLHQH